MSTKRKNKKNYKLSTHKLISIFARTKILSIRTIFISTETNDDNQQKIPLIILMDIFHDFYQIFYE